MVYKVSRMNNLLLLLPTLPALHFYALSECSAQDPTSEPNPIFNYEPELEIILRYPNLEIRRNLLVEFAARIGTTDPQNAWLMRNQKMSQADLLIFASTLMNIWGKTQPLKAMELAQSNPDGEFRMFITNSALRGWAEKDHFKALEWASENLSLYYRRTALATVGQVWASKDPQSACIWGANLTNELERVFFISEVLSTWTKHNSYDAIQWYKTRLKSAAGAPGGVVV